MNESNPTAVSTGIEGLDEILRGGLPAANLHLMQGEPGVGKTTAALQFLMAGVANGERCLYVTLSQTKPELEAIAASHGWSLKGIRIEELAASDVVASAADQTIFQTADFRLDETRLAVERAIDEHKPHRIVYDSLLEIRLLSGDPPSFRRELMGLKAFLAQRDIIALLLDTPTNGSSGNSEIEALAHGVICFTKENDEYGTTRRRIEVSKMRGVPVADGYHDMAIREGDGIVVYPRIVPRTVADEGKPHLIKSGVDALDEMFGGGQEAGTTTLVIGQSGTGKSTMASLYATAALERGEDVALFLFEERQETFLRRSEGLGMELRQHHENGRLLLRDFNPNEVSPGEFAQIVQGIIDEGKTRVVVIDSFTGYINSLPMRHKAVQDIQSLLKYLARAGVLTMLIVAQHGLLGENMGTDIDVSFLGDTVLFLRLQESEGSLRRTITVVKKRHGPHLMQVQELTIDSSGVQVLSFNPLPDVG
jgi:circadian clock protein KaiC